jgi:hypothetical protein
MTEDAVDDDVLDLTAIARAHPARKVRLDLSKVMAEGLLSVGDIVDMAEKLHTDPAQLGAVMEAGGESVAIDVGIALAWVIGRKADPALSYDEVRTSWQIDSRSSPPDPTPPTPPALARASSSA